MKKVILALFLCFVFVKIEAQDHKILIGANGGYGMSKVFGNQYFENYATQLDRFKSSWTIGLIFQFNLGKRFSLVANPMFEAKGGRSDEEGWLSDERVVGDFSYFSIPLLAKFSFGNEVKFFIDVGPYVSFLNSATRYFTNNPDNYLSLSGERDLSSRYKDVDVGIILGLGTDIPLNDLIILTFGVNNGVSLARINLENQGAKLLRDLRSNQRHYFIRMMLGCKFIIPRV